MPELHIGEDLRAVMRHVPSPVTIVTFVCPDGARGITIGSFTSVSLDPPLISFNVMHDSSMHDVFLEVESYAIQILRDDQSALSERFSIPEQSSKAQFRDVPYQLGEDAIPILDNVLAVLRCRPFNAIPAGDHTLFIGEVVDAVTSSEGSPLLYYRQSYRKVGSKVVD